MKKDEVNPLLNLSKNRKVIFVISFSCIMGFLAAVFSSSWVNRFLIFSVTTPIFMYIFYIGLFEYLTRVGNIIPNNFRKIIRMKVFYFWLIFLIVWLFVFGFFIVKINSQILTNFWVFSFIAFFIIYPCIYSLSVYIPSFQYLDSPEIDRQKRKNFANDLVVLTAGLGTPWLLVVLIFVSQINAFPIWVNYIIGIIVVYIATFFLAIYYPYYLGVEKEKKIKLSELMQSRGREIKKLEKLYNGEFSDLKLSERIAVELYIGRIDRDISEVKSESSHPYSPIKPIMGFIIVSILANIFVQVVLKFALHIG
jgi:hypothetical protein